MQYTWETETQCRFDLRANSKAEANAALDALIPQLTQIITSSSNHNKMNSAAPTLRFSIHITQLHKTPSLPKIRALAAALRALRPHLVQSLQETTIHVQTRMQQALLNLVFRLQPPSTPIRVKRDPQLSKLSGTVDLDTLTLSLEESNKLPRHRGVA